MPRAYHEHPIFRVSNVARPVDPRYPTNKAVMMIMPLALVAGAIWGWQQGLAWADAGLRGVVAAVTVFGAWALGRELDPDHNATAFVAMAGAAAALLAVGDVDLWTLMLAIVLTRIVNRTVGPPAKTSDLLLVGGLVAAAIIVAGRWSLGVTAVVTVVLDAALSAKGRDGWIYAALGAAGIATFVVVSGPVVTIPARPLLPAGLALLGLVGLVTTPAVEAPCDLPGHATSRRRIMGGGFVALSLFVVAQLETGALAAVGVGVALAAILPGRMLARVRSKPAEG